MQNEFLPPETFSQSTPYVVASDQTQETETTETPISVQAVAELLAQVQRKVRRRKKKIRVSLVMFGVTLLIMCLFEIIPGWLSAASHRHWLPLIFPGFCGLILGVITGVAITSADSDIDLLAQSAGKKAIPTLLDALTINASSAYNKPYSQALITLLPQLQATDAPLLTPTHRRYLNALLRKEFLTIAAGGPEDALVLAILKAYEQVGDAKAIPSVERLANIKVRSKRQREIQHAAQECLSLLRVHVGGMDATQTLLRASLPDTNTPDILLRPVVSAPCTPDSELLRAARSDDVPPIAR